MKNICLLALFACAATSSPLAQYHNFAPNTANIPFFERRGDLFAGLGWGKGEQFDAFEAQSAYAFSNHFAAMANYMGDRKPDVRKREAIGTDYFLAEAAIGAYEHHKKTSSSIWAGYSVARAYSHYGASYFADFDIRRYFLQTGITYRGGLFQAGYVMRFSYIHHRSGDISFQIPQESLLQIRRLEENTPLFRSEVGLQAGIFVRPVAVCLNVTSFFSDAYLVNFARTNACLSLSISLNTKGKEH